MMIACEVCKREGAEFSVPYDPIGIELMKAHLSEHTARNKEA